MNHYLKISIIALAFCLFSFEDSVAQGSADGQRILLWPGGAPVDRSGGTEAVEVPITIHRPTPEKSTGTAMIICPGGGYGRLVMGGEGHGIAAWLVENGITGIVLEYRLPRQRPYVPLLDAQRAIRMTRTHATEWGIKPDRIGIIGFSAGGHLAATAVTHFDAGDPNAEDPVERVSSRPDFGILVYPVVSLGKIGHGGTRTNLLGPKPSPDLLELFSNEKQVTKETPPVFLAHALDDTVVIPAHSKQLYEALQAEGIPTNYLELPSGGHGLNGYKGPMWDAWQTGSLQWLREVKFLESLERRVDPSTTTATAR
jgi:acetyl esterase/lipase